MLWSAQSLGLLTAVQGGSRHLMSPALPHHAALRWLVVRLVPGRAAREQARVTLHHRVARIGRGWTDEGDAPSEPAIDSIAHRLGTEASLPPAATAERQHGAPLRPVEVIGQQLGVARVDPEPVVLEREHRAVGKAGEEGCLFSWLQNLQQVPRAEVRRQRPQPRQQSILQHLHCSRRQIAEP